MSLLVDQNGKVTDEEDHSNQWGNLDFDKEVLPSLGELGWEMCGVREIAVMVEMDNTSGDITPGATQFYFKKAITGEMDV